MIAAGFEPAKRDAQDLKSYPIDQTRGRYLNASLKEGFILLKKDYIHDGIRTRNLQIRSLPRYPVAPHGQTMNLFHGEINFLFILKDDSCYLRRGSNPRPRAHKTRALTN